MSEAKALTIHRAQQYAITVMIAFCTFMLGDMYKDWKAHLKEDAETRNMVERHDVMISQQGAALNFLTGRMEVISDRLNTDK